MNRITVVVPEVISRIAPEIYGHFSEHIGGVFYGGLWVGKDSDIPNIKGFRADAVEMLRKLRPPVLRWPGGCFAETYAWRDGIGGVRPVRKNWWYPHDGRLETNEVGTHEFIDLCEAIGAKPYFAMNVTSATPMDARDWMDYCLSPRGSTTLSLEREKNGRAEPFDIPYWGVGNENWGGGGNMTADFYASEYKRFATVMDNVSRTPKPDGRGVTLIAGGANGTDYAWTRGLSSSLAASGAPAGGMSFHYYTGTKYGCFDMSREAWNSMIDRAAGIEEAVIRHYAIIRGYGLDRKMPRPLVIDEWGCWYPGGSGPSAGANLFEEQSTVRDAVITALTLNIFNRHADKIMMANVAQICNNLHCMLLIDGGKCVATPSYHVFDMYKEHQGANSLRVLTDCGDGARLSVSASEKDGGRILLTVANLSPETDAEARLDLLGVRGYSAESAYVLCSGDPADCNTAEHPDRVSPRKAEAAAGKPLFFPKASVTAVTLRTE